LYQMRLFMRFLNCSLSLNLHALKKSMSAFWIVVGVALLLLSNSPAIAQEDEIESRIQRLSQTEVNRLRAIVDSPAPSAGLHTTLRQHFSDKAVAARTLGDPKAYIQILREAISLLPDAYLRNNLANQLAAVGEFDEADKFYQLAISLQLDLGEKSLSQANRLYLIYQKRDWAQLNIEGPQLQAQLSHAFRAASPTQRFAILRAQSITAQAISLNHESRGRYEESMEQARESLRYAEQAQVLIGSNPTSEQQQFASRVIWQSLRRIVSASRVAGRLSDTESALANFYAFSLSSAMSDARQAIIFRLASELRLAQKDFAGALRYANRALERTTAAQTPVNEVIAYKVNLLRALIGGQNFSEAVKVIADFDSLAKEQPRLTPRLLYRLERGIVAIAQQQWTTAARALESGYKAYAVRWGDDHPTTVATQGLLGLALWRQAILW
jgi:tetratricopeptide (TPR) repeat protein